MIMQGDIKRIVDQVNEIVEKLVVRIGVLEDEVVVLKAAKEQKPANKSTKSKTLDTNP
jgi:uncharacterized small protein (DUF1192 family)